MTHANQKKDNLKQITIEQVQRDGSFQCLIEDFDGNKETKNFTIMNDVIKYVILQAGKFKSFFVVQGDVIP